MKEKTLVIQELLDVCNAAIKAALPAEGPIMHVPEIKNFVQTFDPAVVYALLAICQRAGLTSITYALVPVESNAPIFYPLDGKYDA